MKRTIGFVCMTVLLLFLGGCCRNHEWVEATCTQAKYCAKCGEREGTMLGHTWKEATCTTPKTCTVCGATEGEPLGHKWVDRTTEAPKTCSLCGLTEGEPIYCVEYTIPKIRSEGASKIRFYPESIYVAENGKDEVRVYNYAETLITTINIVPDDALVWAYSFDIIHYPLVQGDMALITTYRDGNDNCQICLYDHMGKRIADLNMKVDMPEGEWLDPYNICDDRYIECFPSSFDGHVGVTPTALVDCVDLCLADPNMKFDFETHIGSIYVSCTDNPGEAAIYSYVVRKDGKEGYLNRRYHYEEAMYSRATQFNGYGYALVSNDRKTFDIIDVNLKVVGEKVVEGDDAYWVGDAVFCVKKDGETHYYSVK